MKKEYFSSNDLAYGNYANQVSQSIEKLLSKKERDLGDYLNLAKIREYLNNHVVLNNCSNEFRMDIEETKEEIDKLLGRFFSKISFEELIDGTEKIVFSNIKPFISALEKYGITKRISDEEFRLLVKKIPNSLFKNFLTSRMIVRDFPEVLTQCIISNPGNTKIVIETVLSEERLKEKIFFPKSFTEKLRDNLFSEYINQEYPNPSYLRTISEGKFTPEVDSLVKLRAKQKYDEIITNYFRENENVAVKFGVHVSILPLQTAKIVEYANTDSEIIEIKINENWLNESKDYASILQNLIYVFGLVDTQFKFSALIDNEEDGLESFLFMKEKNSYEAFGVFRNKEMIYVSLVTTYLKFLNNNGIVIEDIFKWFFEEYLPIEFNIDGFNIKVPHEEDSYYEKNVRMHLQLHRILKQYYLYGKYGEINKILVNSIQVPRTNELFSLADRKYIYIDSDDFYRYAHILFSDQSVFGCNEEFDTAIAERLVKGVPKNIFEEQDISTLDILLEEGILINKSGTIKWASTDLFILMRILFYKKSLNYYWVSPKFRKFIDRFVSNGKLRVENKLFSKEESDYLNYYLTNFFSNGLGLRNKYVHGSTEDLSEEEHLNNYHILIYLFSLLIIKINEEFDFRDKIIENERE